MANGWSRCGRTGRGFIVPFMHDVFTEPGSDDVIAEMIAIGLEATPEVAVAQELELDWERPARLLAEVSTPDARDSRCGGRPVPASHAERIVAAMPNARLELIAAGGHRPDIPHARARQPAPARVPAQPVVRYRR